MQKAHVHLGANGQLLAFPHEYYRDENVARIVGDNAEYDFISDNASCQFWE
jgi:hypothetical protein